MGGGPAALIEDQCVNLGRAVVLAACARHDPQAAIILILLHMSFDATEAGKVYMRGSSGVGLGRQKGPIV